MTTELAIGHHGSAIVALLSIDGEAEAAVFDRVDRPDPTDAIHRVRPLRRIADLDATIVDMGDGQKGIVRQAPSQQGSFLAQVSKPARGGKRAELRADPMLAGTALLRRLDSRRLTLSSRIEDRKAARARASALGIGRGWVLRHRFQESSDKAIEAEMADLEAKADRLRIGTTIGCVRAPPPVWQRLRDHYGLPDRTLADPNVAGLLPDGAERVSVDLADFVAAHGEPQVPLARGARLWIEATRALTAVDVDAGGGSPRAANAAAPEALARALRLRNIAGTIVVDLINRAGDWSTDLDAWRDALARDWLPVSLPARVSPLGLIEIARPRRGYSLAEAIEPAPAGERTTS